MVLTTYMYAVRDIVTIVLTWLLINILVLLVALWLAHHLTP